MEKLTIGFVTKEFTILDKAYLFDILANGLESKISLNYYLLFILLDENNNLIKCFIPPDTFKNSTNEAIDNVASFCESIAGSKLKLNINGDITGKDLDLFLKGENICCAYLQDKVYKTIVSFSVDHSEKSKDGIKLYQYLKKKTDLKFKEMPGSIRYIEGGYDVNAAFDGNPEAYWNID